MEKFVTKMIAEHSELVERTAKLNSFVYSEESSKVPAPEFANLCIQLRGMKMYEEALRARLLNQGVVYEDGEYFEHINTNKQSCEKNSEKE